MRNQDRNIIILGLIVVATILLWQAPFGRYALYPFIILGTWFHEMGHGLAAMLLGGNFKQLEIYSNGSGLAIHSGSLFLGPIGSAIVAAAGPIGPTLAGAGLVISSSKKKNAKIALIILSVLLIVSPVIWIRSIFGFLIILVFGIASTLIALKGNDRLIQFTAQFLGVQAWLSLYLSIDYLFSAGAEVGGSRFMSDTSVISENLFLPYWIWAGLIVIFSAFVIYRSISYVRKH